ncbi:MAG TPA: hypothetical protein VHA57_01495, partial [Actinomycetota bacterium]|nr:hypothetical protein [Actinomycetota bacterium]
AGGATPSAQSTGKAGGNASSVTPKALSGGTGAPPEPTAKPKPRSSAANPDVSAGAGAAGPSSPTPACDATLPAVKDVGITGVQMGRVAADGSIQATSTFSAASDRKIIAVVTLNPQLAVTGTVIDYATIYGCSYHPSDTYTLTKPLTYFYAEFDAATTPFTPGTYHLRFFINSVAAWDVGYTITP